MGGLRKTISWYGGVDQPYWSARVAVDSRNGLGELGIAWPAATRRRGYGTTYAEVSLRGLGQRGEEHPRSSNGLIPGQGTTVFVPSYRVLGIGSLHSYQESAAKAWQRDPPLQWFSRGICRNINDRRSPDGVTDWCLSGLEGFGFLRCCFTVVSRQVANSDKLFEFCDPVDPPSIVTPIRPPGRQLTSAGATTGSASDHDPSFGLIDTDKKKISGKEKREEKRKRETRKVPKDPPSVRSPASQQR